MECDYPELTFKLDKSEMLGRRSDGDAMHANHHVGLEGKGEVPDGVRLLGVVTIYMFNQEKTRKGVSIDRKVQSLVPGVLLR